MLCVMRKRVTIKTKRSLHDEKPLKTADFCRFQKQNVILGQIRDAIFFSKIIFSKWACECTRILLGIESFSDEKHPRPSPDLFEGVLGELEKKEKPPPPKTGF